MKAMDRGVFLGSLAFLLGLSAGTIRAAEIKGTVLDMDGKPLPETEVVLEIGRAHYVLGKHFDRWISVRTKKGKTDGEGKILFEDLPEGTLGTAHVKDKEGFGVARGMEELEVRMRPLGKLRGAVVGGKKQLRGLRVYVRGGDGFGGERGIVKADRRMFEVSGLVPGEAKVYLMRDNFTVAEANALVEAGKTRTAKPIRVGAGFLPGPDPLVDCIKAKLVDRRGRPVVGVQLVWSSQWMDGGMSSDKKGIVRLAGGGVAIGGPPYYLRLRALRGKTETFTGAYRRTAGGCAVVELQRMQEIMGTVKRGEKALSEYKLLVLGPGKTAHVHYGSVEGGRYTVKAPEGKCTFFVGTVDGKIHEHAFKVERSGEDVIHEIKLGGK